MYERTLAPGFHDLVFGMLRNAGIVPHVSQTAGEMPTLISLVDAGMGLSVLPASAVKHRRRFSRQRYASPGFNPRRRAYSTKGSFEAAASRNLCSQTSALASRSSSFIMPSISVVSRRHPYQAILLQSRVGKIECLPQNSRKVQSPHGAIRPPDAG
jgi:hypothetical protein